MITVRELIEQLERVEDKEKVVFAFTEDHNIANVCFVDNNMDDRVDLNLDEKYSLVKIEWLDNLLERVKLN